MEFTEVVQTILGTNEIGRRMTENQSEDLVEAFIK